MKTFDYIIVLKKRNYTTVDNVSQIMLLIAIIAFIGNAANGATNWVSSIAFAILTAGWGIFCIWQKKRGTPPFFRFGLLLGAMGWYSMEDGLWIALIYLLAAMLEKQVKFPEEIAFDENEIVFNSFPKKRYEWGALNNVVLKDGLLTLDFKNDKLIQKELESETTKNTEEEFNAFAKALIEKTAYVS
ncbi:MAG TPA: hypothetical protein VJA82_03045 [Sediminibacterium sp.]|uniref:hypothetical protein n=1 Tax=Sediminibacterium sp. TaxID=1917865 RepID=UPI0008C0DAC0|nr:hypothetical protein [Sediminibacterium sp.]OHC85070.1 MAG: hypothetical protein A2472_10010 [Sphingobacteriia bacterium RIFOXYC2_FULL_35_18]OHC87120.1 MAG: hypothetical protein A2546_14600 [Sphingobacteriia bacterium RIFOXYD2_FULL_35_12]HLD52258.1 hypothetical protein [Sediminibacterium sp.]